MKTVLLALLALATSFPLAAQNVITFEGLGLPLDTFLRSTDDEQITFQFEPFEAPSEFVGGFWSGGWAASTSRNDSVGDFNNLYGSAAGDGADGSATYFIGQDGAYWVAPNGADGFAVNGFDFVNTAYASTVIRDGNSFSRAFGTDSTGMQAGVADSFLLNVCGYLDGNPVWIQKFPLADFRFDDDQDDFIRTEWTSADVGQAGTPVDSVSFRLESSDIGMFGSNTPSFFAIDNVEAFPILISARTPREVTRLRVYPTPSLGLIRVDAASSQGELTLIDQDGRVLGTIPATALWQPIDLSALKDGTYYLRGDTAEGTAVGTIVLRR